MDSLAKRIKQVRVKADMNRSEFARALGVSAAHISAIEKGSAASEQFLKAVAVRFKVQEAWLINGDSESIRQPEPSYDLHGGYVANFEKSMGVSKGSEEWELLGMLYEIIRDNDPAYRMAVMSNLRAFATAIRERRKRAEIERDLESMRKETESLKTQLAELRAIVQEQARAATYYGTERRSGHDRRLADGQSPTGEERRSNIERRVHPKPEHNGDPI